MDERDFHLLVRAKRQIHREAKLRSFLIFGVCFTACLRLLGFELPFLYLALFVLLLIALVLNSDLIANFGMVSKKDLVAVIERHIHSDPEAITRYVNAKSRV
ncbi:MAG: hypothetical protein RKH07_16090 [Gammaproteobacteria bacterium]